MKDIINITDYKDWLQDLKRKIQQSQIKAAIQVNSELLRLYWQIGKDIVEKQAQAKWGDGFLQTLSADLCKEFPTMKGFSYRNLKSIRQWYLFYNQLDIIGKQVVSQLEVSLFSIPWGHHIMIMQRCKNTQEALFYVHKTIENHWSRSVLEHQIALNLYVRQGKAITNFQHQLPPAMSDLAQELTKDPYIFDFLSITENYTEKELQQYLEDNMTKFLLELGKGFCFYGKQVHINVGGDDFYIDLLFYNAHLHCYVVVELKTTKFKPEHIGQLKFYVTAVNKQLRTEGDAPTIGLLICKDKNNVIAEYTLEDIHNPIEVSSYKLFDELSKDYQSSLPSIEEIEKRLLD
ncbi:PDDEXK nuclease domain-containing protein [Capnocytophaga leadbetteri]|uniref:PDDEXK nuclease domain-containing protein n=1 Tax=Capnocytophaga leadbetteri TaxID=327575 RepID=UPI0028F055B1|nr:PDDEXK nuclease domain-containing protein [Capnocytophaga leadbetteri]